MVLDLLAVLKQHAQHPGHLLRGDEREPRPVYEKSSRLPRRARRRVALAFYNKIFLIQKFESKH